MYNAEDRTYILAKQVIINAVKYAVKDLYVSIADVTQHLLNSPVVVIKRQYLFSWDSVPGDDNDKLIRFLMDDFDIDWADDSEIHKSHDGMTISFSEDENSAEIIMNEKKEKATLKISDGRTCDLKVKNENGKLNIYKRPNEQPTILTILEDEYKTIQNAYDFNNNEANITELKIKKNYEDWKKIRKVKSDVLKELKFKLKFKFTLNDSEKAEIEVWLDKNAYLFSWDSVPGSDNEKLIKFLKDDFDIDWAEDSEICKSEDRTIGISKDGNSAVIKIDEEEEEKATLKISDGRTCDLKVKNENGKLNIYKNVTIEEAKELSNDYKRFLDNLKDAIKEDMKNNNFPPKGANGNENEFEWDGVPLEMEEFGFLGSILDKLITRTAPCMENFELKGEETLIQTFFLRVKDTASYGQFRYVLSNEQLYQVSANDSHLQKSMYDLIEKRTDPNIFSEYGAKNLDKKIREMPFLKRINSATWSGDPKKTTIGYLQAIQGDISLYLEPGLFRIYGDLFHQHEKEKGVKDRYNEDYLKVIAELVMIGPKDENDEIIQIQNLPYLGIPIKEREGIAQGVLQIISQNKIDPETRLRILDVIWHLLNEIKGYLHADTEHFNLSNKRLLERMSAFAHLTSHSSTKLFTTPIRESADSIEQDIEQLSSKLEKNRESLKGQFERMKSITERELPIIKRTIRFWESYLTVMDRYGKIESGKMEFDPHSIDWNKMQEELGFYGKLLFYSYSNDLYDDKRYENFRDLIENKKLLFHGVSEYAFLNLNIPTKSDLPGTLYAHQEILAIHLINFLANAIEAANLTEAAKVYDRAGVITPRVIKKIDLNFKATPEDDPHYIVLEIRNNCGITEEEKTKLDDLKQTIESFQDTDEFGMGMGSILDKKKELQVNMAMRKFTSKSGEGLGWAVLLAADYLHSLGVYKEEKDEKNNIINREFSRRGKLLIDVNDNGKRGGEESGGEEWDVTFKMYFPSYVKKQNGEKIRVTPAIIK